MAKVIVMEMRNVRLYWDSSVGLFFSEMWVSFPVSVRFPGTATVQRESCSIDEIRYKWDMG